MATHDKTADTGPICPECGRDPCADPPKPLLVRRAWIVLLVPLSLLVGLVVWKNALRDWTPAPPRWYAPRVGTLDFPPKRVTSADLERMSAGQASAGPLLEFMAERMDHTSSNIHVAFVPPKGDRLDMVRYGWPFQVLLERTQADYDDVFARRGMTLAYPSNSDGWRGWQTRAWVWNSPGPAGVVRIYLLTLDSIIAALVLLVLAWFVGRLARDLACVVQAGRPKGPRIRDHLVRRAPVVVTVVAALLIGVLSVTRPVRETNLSPVPVAAPTTRVVMTGAQLAEVPLEQRRAALARAILEASPPRTPMHADCLAVSVELTRKRVVSNDAVSWPRAVTHATSHDEGVSGPPSWRAAGFNSSSLWIERSTPDRAFWERYTIVAPTLVMYLGAPIAVGLLWAAAINAAMWRRRRRSSRRAATGLCLTCGYELGS